MEEDPAGELIRRTARGDRQAFDALVETTRDGVWRYLRAHTASDGVAEDALQETYLAAAGCPLAQGYGYARPMPVDSLMQLAAEESKRADCTGIGA